MNRLIFVCRNKYVSTRRLCVQAHYSQFSIINSASNLPLTLNIEKISVPVKGCRGRACGIIRQIGVQTIGNNF